MLHAEIIVAERFAGGVRGIERGTETDADLRLGGSALDARFAGERGSDGGFEAGDVHAGFLQDRCGDASFLLEQGEQHVQALQLGMSGFGSDALR